MSGEKTEPLVQGGLYAVTHFRLLTSHNDEALMGFEPPGECITCKLDRLRRGDLGSMRFMHLWVPRGLVRPF